MADDLSGGMNWQQLFPWGMLLRAMRLAVGARVLLLAAVGLGLTWLGWAAAARAFDIQPHGPFDLSVSEMWPWEAVHPLNVQGEMGQWRQQALSEGHTLLLPWEHLSWPLRHAFNSRLGLTEFAYLLTCGVWAVMVWALAGGAIARGAAVALARDEHLNSSQVLGYARGKWRSLAAAPLLVLLGIAMLAIPLAVLGLLMRVVSPGAGMMLAGMTWPLVLLIGVAMTILALGLLFGWPLMWATIAAEGTDAFDAISRSYAYVYHRPLHYLFYAAQAALLGLVGWLLVHLFAVTVLTLTGWGVSWGKGVDSADTVFYAFVAPNRIPPGMESAGATLVRFWIGVLWTIEASFSYSYLFTAATAIYFVLRQQVDATELDEVFLPDAGVFDLPPLENDDAGVPRVAQSERGNGPSNPNEAGIAPSGLTGGEVPEG